MKMKSLVFLICLYIELLVAVGTKLVRKLGLLGNHCNLHHRI